MHIFLSLNYLKLCTINSHHIGIRYSGLNLRFDWKLEEIDAER